MIQKTDTLPENSLLKEEDTPHHYIDTFQLLLLNTQKTRNVNEMLALFLASGLKT